MTWSPLACGIVSGKYDSGIPPYSRASLKVKELPGSEEGTGRGQAFCIGEASLGLCGGGSPHVNLEPPLAGSHVRKGRPRPLPGMCPR